MKRILILGATSGIAQAVARRWAAEGCAFHLVGRNPARTEAVARDLEVRGARAVHWESIDLRETAAHAPLLERAVTALSGLDVVLIAHGVLSDAGAAEGDVRGAVAAFDLNATSTVSLALHAAALLESRGAGTLVVIGSVAGDRGRRSNYPYGAAKAAVDALMAGLRYRLAQSGVRAVLIKPGPVRTPMTAHLPDGPLVASAEKIAPVICRAIRRGTPVVYVPWFWRWIMLVIRHVPDRVFRHAQF